jgi:hypothetical protein
MKKEIIVERVCQIMAAILLIYMMCFAFLLTKFDEKMDQFVVVLAVIDGLFLLSLFYYMLMDFGRTPLEVTLKRFCKAFGGSLILMGTSAFIFIIWALMGPYQGIGFVVLFALESTILFLGIKIYQVRRWAMVAISILPAFCGLRGFIFISVYFFTKSMQWSVIFQSLVEAYLLITPALVTYLGWNEFSKIGHIDPNEHESLPHAKL